MGTDLLRNPAVRFDAPAEDRLRHGLVDERVMGLLAVLAQGERFEVTDFPTLPGEPTDTPSRSVDLDASVDASVATLAAGQRGAFRPMAVTPGDGVTRTRITYAVAALS